jgi:glycosyltransferase involved in cell wall biosynthesis
VAQVTPAKPLLLHVITRLCVGGAQLSVFHLSRDLRDEYDVHIVCGPDVGDEGSIFEEVSAEFPTTLLPVLRRPLRPAADVRAARALRRLYERLSPAVVHTHSSKAGVLGRWAARGSGAAVVHTVHGWGHTPADPRLRRRGFVAAERRAARWSDRLIAVSTDVRDEGLRHGIGRPDQYEVVPEYVDYSPADPDFNHARAAARAALALPPEVETMGWVGRFMPQKDPATLARAVAALLAARPGVHACFVGDGPDRAEVERTLRLGGLGERVHFAGFRKDIRPLYAAFDVLLHTSLWEGQPRVPQEAIAERVPVVTARVSGTRDLIGSGPVGFEVEPGDSAAFAARAAEVLDDPGLRAPLPAAAVEAVASANGHELALSKHRELYAELLSRRR